MHELDFQGSSRSFDRRVIPAIALSAFGDIHAEPHNQIPIIMRKSWLLIYELFDAVNTYDTFVIIAQMNRKVHIILMPNLWHIITVRHRDIKMCSENHKPGELRGGDE